MSAALEAGARALTGGTRGNGNGQFFPPTVLVDVTPDMDCLRDETFGPTLPIVRVRDVDEAVALANDSPYGLGATVFTRDARRGEEVARRLEAGNVAVNDPWSYFALLDLPMGGWKESGLGSRHGPGGNPQVLPPADHRGGAPLPPPRAAHVPLPACADAGVAAGAAAGARAEAPAMRPLGLASRAAVEAHAIGQAVRAGMFGVRAPAANGARPSARSSATARSAVPSAWRPSATATTSALVDELGELTFGELDRRSNALANAWRVGGHRRGRRRRDPLPQPPRLPRRHVRQPPSSAPGRST